METGFEKIVFMSDLNNTDSLAPNGLKAIQNQLRFDLQELRGKNDDEAVRQLVIMFKENYGLNDLGLRERRNNLVENLRNLFRAINQDNHALDDLAPIFEAFAQRVETVIDEMTKGKAKAEETVESNAVERSSNKTDVQA